MPRGMVEVISYILCMNLIIGGTAGRSHDTSVRWETMMCRSETTNFNIGPLFS